MFRAPIFRAPIFRAIASPLALLGALALGGAAFAGTVDVTYQQSNNVWGDYGHVDATLTISYPVGQTTVAGGAGAFAMTDLTGTLGDAAGNFIAFCVDVADYIQNPPGWHEISGAVTSVGFSDYKIYPVQALFNTAYTDVLEHITDGDLVAGFQLALWELLYEPAVSEPETDPSPWNLTGGSFSVAGAPQGALDAAAGFLAGLNGEETGEYALTFLKSTETGKNGKLSQNLITAGWVAPVPLPAGGLLLLAGLAGLGAAAARRRRAA